MKFCLKNIDENEYKSVIQDGSILEQKDFCEQFFLLELKQQNMFLKILINEASKDIIPGGFRSYDIRINSDKLPNHVVFYIALKALPLLKKFTNCNNSTFVIGIGRACEKARPSSSRIFKSYYNALKLSGVKLINLGVTTTPDVYFAAAYLKQEYINAVINISASHNPSRDNGIKHCIVLNDGFIHSISSNQMNEIKISACNKDNKNNNDIDIIKSIVNNNNNNNNITSSPKLFEDSNAVSTLHNAFIIASAFLGFEAMTKLNQRCQGDFKQVLQKLAPQYSHRDIIDKISRLINEPWDHLLKRLQLNPDFQKPAQFKENPLKDFVIILDFGTGTAFRTATIYQALGAKVIPLDLERGFNPLETNNQANLKEALKIAAKTYPDKEIIGLAHDEDGDRLGVMRKDLIPVGGDRLLVISCKQIAKNKNSSKTPLVVTEVKSRPETRQALINMGITPLIAPTGFAFIKGAAIGIEKALRNLKENPDLTPETIELYGTTLNLKNITPVLMWAELSGHFGFSQNLSYFFDDASLMAVNLLVTVLNNIQDGSKPGESLINLDNSFPKNKSSDELNIFVKTNDPEYVPSSSEKEKLIEKFYKYFKNLSSVKQVHRIDGIEIIFEDDVNPDIKGWILARKSNNEDKIVVVTSAPTQDSLNLIETIFFKFALTVSCKSISGLVLKKSEQQGKERIADPYVVERIRFLCLEQN